MRERGLEEAIARTNEGSLDWAVLYEEHALALARYARRFVKREEDALDLMQDGFLRAMNAGRQPAPADVRPWLYRIVSNLAIDRLRRERLVRFLPLPRTGVPSGGRAFDPEAEQVRVAMRRIAPEQAVTLSLALHEGFSRREIAKVMGVSEETVKSRLARGRLAFARAYRDPGGVRK